LFAIGVSKMHFKFQAFKLVICAQLVLSFTTLTRHQMNKNRQNITSNFQLMS
jgi:hypothetical protein